MNKLAIFLSTLVLLAIAGTMAFAQNYGNSDPKKPETTLGSQYRVSTSTIRWNATTTPAANLECIKAAVSTREATIDTSYDTMTTAIKNALATRKAELDTAWGMSVNKDRKAAVKAAWTKFNKANRDARNVYRTSVKAAWKKFNTDSKSCNVPSRMQEAQGTDVSL